MTDLLALPKAELHLHLEGAIRPSTARELAERYGRPMPRTGRFTDLSEFVVAYEQARDLIGSLDDLRRVAAELLTTARENGVVWTEVHLIPPTYAGRLGPDEAVVEAVLDGLAAGSDDAAGAGLIIGVNRMLPVEAAERSLTLALTYRDRGVVGLGWPRTRRGSRPGCSPRCSAARPLPGCRPCRTPGRAPGPRACGPAWSCSARGGSTTACGRSRTRRSSSC